MVITILHVYYNFWIEIWRQHNLCVSQNPTSTARSCTTSVLTNNLLNFGKNRRHVQWMSSFDEVSASLLGWMTSSSFDPVKTLKPRQHYEGSYKSPRPDTELAQEEWDGYGFSHVQLFIGPINNFQTTLLISLIWVVEWSKLMIVFLGKWIKSSVAQSRNTTFQKD